MSSVLAFPSRAITALVLTTVIALPASTQQNSEPSDIANAPSTSVNITVNVLSNRHSISPYIYGVNFPPDTTYIQQTGATLVRWGGNAATRYNWKTFDTNAANDWYFDNRPMGDPPIYSDSTQFVNNVAGAGASPIMTLGMLPWAAKDASSYSFSVAKYGQQCAKNPFNSDDGDGLKT